jgi:hypothetical protein
MEGRFAYMSGTSELKIEIINQFPDLGLLQLVD